MVRPRKKRMVGYRHRCRRFNPDDTNESMPVVDVGVDELESMRLNILEKLSQGEAAQKMGVHQSTFQRTLRRGLEKVTDALVNGKSIFLEGGEVNMPGGDGTGPDGTGPTGARGQGRRGGGNRPGRGAAAPQNCRCPSCGHLEPHQPGVPCSQAKCPECGSQMVRG